MPEALLMQLESFAKAKHQIAPGKIIHLAEVEKAAKQPKRPRDAQWWRDRG
jgi:hypothetical protein